MITLEDRIKGGVYALIIGDALGVPVEFTQRVELQKNPVIGYRSYGSHNQPSGTWSDDSSLMLCTLESLHNGIDYDAAMKSFEKWFSSSYMTATGTVFDVGGTTSIALLRYKRGIDAIACGPTDENSNGNGSLMRILPIAFEMYGSDDNTEREVVFNYSALTHGHIRSKIACWFYCRIIRNIIAGESKEQAVDDAYAAVEKWCAENSLADEFSLFKRCKSTIAAEPLESIQSSGYVLHTFEASLYSFLKGGTVIDALLMSVNMGRDTDTVAAVTGGLAGTYYGINAIDKKWIDGLQSKDKIEEVLRSYIQSLSRA